MKHLTPILFTALLIVASCTSQKKLAYLYNLPEAGSEEYFPMDVPDYRLQSRDILYITAKAMTPDGKISDFLSSGSAVSSQMDASGGYLSGTTVNEEGDIVIAVVGTIKVGGLTLNEARKLIQVAADKVFNNTTIDCKLQSFKFTIIGEVNSPGTYMNYNNYLTVLEAIGRAGGVGNYGNRYKILVIRPVDKGTRTFTLNLQDKKILSSEAYFLLPNDVVIVQAMNQKIFNMNMPTIAFIISTLTGTVSMTLLLINFLEK